MKTIKIPEETHLKLMTYKTRYYKIYGVNLKLYEIIDLLIQTENLEDDK